MKFLDPWANWWRRWRFFFLATFLPFPFLSFLSNGGQTRSCTVKSNDEWRKLAPTKKSTLKWMCKISCWHNILVIAELWHAKRACGAPWVSESTHPRKFGNHVTVHRPPARPSAPQGNQCLILTLSSQFGSTGRLILHTYCTSMLWSIDSCQNRVSADQYHLTVSRAQVSTHRGRVSFWSYPLTSY